MELLFSVALALFLLAVGLLGYYSLLQILIERVRQDAHHLSGELRSFEVRYRRIQADTQGYGADDPEPYGAKAHQLIQLDEQLGQFLVSTRERYVHIQQNLPRQPGTWYTPFKTWPFHLIGLRREINQILGKLKSQALHLDQAEQLSHDLAGLSWRIAQEARQLIADQLALAERLQVMHDHKVRGAALDALEAQAAQIELGLAQIPELFLDDDEAQVIQQAERASVVQVYQSLARLRPAWAQCDEQLRTWEAQLVRLNERVSSLMRSLAGVEQTLDSSPASLLRSELDVEFEHLTARQQQLQMQVSRPELEKLADLHSQADQLIQALQAFESDLRATRQSLEALQQILVQAAAEQKKLSDRYAALGTDRKHRVIWSRSSAILASLSQQLGKLGPAELARSPAQIEQDLENANQLALRQVELETTLQQVAAQQDELAALLDGPELGQALLWAQNTQKTLQQTRLFHADNWPRADGVSALPGELDELLGLLKVFAAGWPPEGIAEEQLGTRLENGQRLMASYQALRARVAIVETRLIELQHTENQARETLEDTRKVLTQAGLLASSNPFLSGIAAREIERLVAQVDKQLAELDQRQQGVLESKARQASGLSLRLEQGLNGWLERLNQDIQEKVKSLTASLTRLDSIAPLDEAQVAAARRLLASGENLLPAPGEKPRFTLEKAVLELKRRSEMQQSCTAATQALADLEKPVVESYQAASQIRQQVLTQFDEINTWLKQTRAWPPVAVDVEPEYKVLGSLESSWKALKSQPAKAIDLVKQLGDFGREYQALGGKVQQLTERGSREQKEIQKLENELDEYLSKWERLLEKYPDQAVVVEEIRSLLDDSDQELFQIKQSYREGALNYDEVYQKAQNLHRKVRLFQVALDETHTLDVSGKIITSRESRRTTGEW